MNKNKILLIFVFLIAICALPIGYQYNKYREYLSDSQQVLENISNQLNVEPNWETVRFEIYCHILYDNVTLDEIKEKLTGITEFEISRDDEEYLYFTLYFTNPYVEIDDVGLAFNEDFQLLEKFRRVGLGGSDFAPISCVE